MSSIITPFERGASLRGRVAHYIRDAIVKGELQPGQKIVESKLAQSIGVSQSLLREAVLELEHQGLVIKFHNRSTYVNRFDKQQVEDGYRLRQEFEPEVAASACQKLTREGAAQLRALLDGMLNAWRSGNYSRASQNDIAFHQLIWKISERATLARALAAVMMPLATFPARNILAYRKMEMIYEDHRALLAALEEGNPEEVIRVFREKLDIFRGQYLEAMDTMGNTAPTSDD